MLTLFIISISVIIVSAFFSLAETSLFTISIAKTQEFVERNLPGSKALMQLQENMQWPITTITILNNLSNIAGTFVCGIIAASVLSGIWVAIYPIVFTVAVIVFAENLPKIYGEKHAHTVALRVAKPIVLLTKICKPFCWFIAKIATKIFGEYDTPTTSEAEIQALTKIAADEGSIEESERRTIEKTFLLNDLTAEDIMTPRVSITRLRGSSQLQDVAEQIMNSQHSRIIVVGKDIDEILGFVLKDELLVALCKNEDKSIKEFVIPLSFVKETDKADSLLDKMLHRKHINVVLDEYGGVSGVVTLEDVIEVITGEIVDETDLHIDMRDNVRQINLQMLQRA